MLSQGTLGERRRGVACLRMADNGCPFESGNWFGFGELYLYVLHSF